MEKTEKQVITSDYSNINLQRPSPDFSVDRFDSAIIKKGYNVYHYRALRCPCLNRENRSPLPNCENCNGLGWFYIEKRQTKALMQGMGNNKKYESWSETNAGSVTITSLFSDDVTYMDKFEIIDLEANFNQMLFTQYYNNTLFAFTVYEPIKIMNIYMFQGSSNPLKTLYSKDERPTDWDYFVDKNKIVFNGAKYAFEDDIAVSVRYKHIPVYCVIDIMRELFKTKDKSCTDLCDEKDLSLRGMPQKSLGRRLHYIFDAKNFSSPSVFDNTDYNKVEDNTIQENNVLF